MTAKKKTDYLVLSTLHPGRMMCFHCGRTETIKYPADLDFVAGVMKVFARLHGKCKESIPGKELREEHRADYEKFKIDQAKRKEESGSVPDQGDGGREV